MDDVSVDESKYTCSFLGNSSRSWKFLKPTLLATFAVIPTIITVTASILLVKHLFYARKVAKRAGNNARWQGIATVVLTAAVYCLSFLPEAIHLVIWSHVSSESYRVIVPRVTETIMFFNVVANVFVYSITVPSFRQFLNTRINTITTYLISYVSVITDRSTGEI